MLVVLAACLAVALACAVVRAGGPRSAAMPVTPAVPAAFPAEPQARAVLRAWDRRRAAAWAEGSVTRLRSLYVDGSRAGSADVRLLRGYRERGWTVRHLRMQVLGFRVLGRAVGRWRLEVSDRVATGAVAVRSSPVDGRRVVLPRDGPSTRVVTLVRGRDGTWRVASVLPR